MSVETAIDRRDILSHQDGDENTALHFGAKNGNVRICSFIINAAKELFDEIDLQNFLNCQNARGFTPLLSVSFRGYHVIGQKDKAVENRKHIIEKLLQAGASAKITRE